MLLLLKFFRLTAWNFTLYYTVREKKNDKEKSIKSIKIQIYSIFSQITNNKNTLRASL